MGFSSSAEATFCGSLNNLITKNYRRLSRKMLPPSGVELRGPAGWKYSESSIRPIPEARGKGGPTSAISQIFRRSEKS
jgi:hypothetical protein